MEALKLTQMANNLDPDFAAPYAQGANCLLQRWAFGWSSGAEDVTEARRLARRATQLDKDHPAVLAVAGAVLAIFVGEVAEGATLLARAISLDPNLAVARIWNGYVQLRLGDGHAAIEQFQIGLRMIPPRSTYLFGPERNSSRIFYTWPISRWVLVGEECCAGEPEFCACTHPHDSGPCSGRTD